MAETFVNFARGIAFFPRPVPPKHDVQEGHEDHARYHNFAGKEWADIGDVFSEAFDLARKLGDLVSKLMVLAAEEGSFFHDLGQGLGHITKSVKGFFSGIKLVPQAVQILSSGLALGVFCYSRYNEGMSFELFWQGLNKVRSWIAGDMSRLITSVGDVADLWHRVVRPLEPVAVEVFAKMGGIILIIASINGLIESGIELVGYVRPDLVSKYVDQGLEKKLSANGQRWVSWVKSGANFSMFAFLLATGVIVTLLAFGVITLSNPWVLPALGVVVFVFTAGAFLAKEGEKMGWGKSISETSHLSSRRRIGSSSESDFFE